MAVNYTIDTFGPVQVQVAIWGLMYTAVAGKQTIITKLIFAEVGNANSTSIAMRLRANNAINQVFNAVGLPAGGYLPLPTLEGYVLEPGETIYAQQNAGAAGTVYMQGTVFQVEFV